MNRQLSDTQIHMLIERFGHFNLPFHNVGAGGVDSSGCVECKGLSLKRLMQVSSRQLKAMGVKS